MRRLAALAMACLVTVAAGCGTDDDSAAATTVLTVYAASSLTGVFEELGERFEAEHDGVEITFSFGGSSDLVAQIQQGAPADVFASADTTNMEKLVADGLQGRDPVPFASNTLQIVTPPDNPAGITSFADLSAEGLNLVICAPAVPCGAATAKVAEAAGVTLRPVSEEQSVKDVLAKVTSGEADAGLVYVTDAKAAGAAVKGIAFPASSSAVNVYPITTVKGSRNAELAAEFLELVLSDAGQAVLAEAAFAKP